jgi:hypothetical protein
MSAARWGTWTRGQEYRSTRDISDPDDNFLSWMNASGRGIKNSGGIRCAAPLAGSAGLPERVPPVIVLTTRDAGAENHASNPWIDTVDAARNRIVYWGDAKFEHNGDPELAKGNQSFRRIHPLVAANRLSEVPPLLHFTTVKKGTVRFNGLCAIAALEEASFQDEQHDAEVPNLRLTLRILPAAEIDTRWVRARITAERPEALLEHAPRAWLDDIAGNDVPKQFEPAAPLPPVKERRQRPIGQPPVGPVGEWLNRIVSVDHREVLTHIANHGSMTEAEVAAALGGAGKARRFATSLDELLTSSAPMRVRVVSIDGIKQYVREAE